MRTTHVVLVGSRKTLRRVLEQMALTAGQVAVSDSRRQELIDMCGKFPEVVVEPAGQTHLAFKVRKKTMAYYLFDHHGDGKIALCCKSTMSEQRRLVRSDPDSFYVPAYLGANGWISVRLDLHEVDWDVVDELLRAAYQAIAPRKLASLVNDSF
jgi:hypothetical protein